MSDVVEVLDSQPWDDAEAHYRGDVGPIENTHLSECASTIENIGWTLGNDCPYRCTHCYSMSARRKGKDLEKWMVDRIVRELSSLGVKTVNLGGNEPLFTNGMNPKATLLPYIIERLVESGILVGLTTSGITLIHLERDHNAAFRMLNDIDISLDSPFIDEHNRNRGASLYSMAMRSLEICQRYEIDHTLIMCAMAWNFSPAHIDAVVEIARQYDAHIRINPLKAVEYQHMPNVLTVDSFYKGFSSLMAQCSQVDLGEPLLATVCGVEGRGCPCGRSSFRIHSITPDGRVPVSPCVYLHDYKVGNLLTDDIWEIVNSQQFRSFRRRNASPDQIPGCSGCEFLKSCRGGCAARSYLHHLHDTKTRTLYVKDPYCLRDYRDKTLSQVPVFPQKPHIPQDKILVHRDYLCTWIGKPHASV
ncbi:MAG: radical SAM protein [Xanthobacteraceae bacterium]